MNYINDIQIEEGGIMRVVLALNTQNWIEAEEQLIKDVVNTKLTHCLGSYKGETERSYMTGFLDAQEIRALAILAAEYKQESTLVIDYTGNAYLMYTDGSKKVEGIGRWGEIDRDKQDNLENWTLTENGTLYTVL